jgi:segregation and condensation protein A
MYKIRLPNFEGPFDLLLYFIKRDELNIYDIPISKITNEVLKYIRLMQLFDLELAGEFILMASTLMYIKTQMLLPRAEVNADGEIEDPRNQLVQNINEYILYKQASMEMSSLMEEHRYDYYRRLFEQDLKLAEANSIQEYKNASLFDLMTAYKKAMDKINEKPSEHLIQLIPISVEEKITFIIDKLKRKARITFFDLVKDDLKINIVVTFLAILDMIRSGKIFIVQDDIFDDIVISLRTDYSFN